MDDLRRGARCRAVALGAARSASLRWRLEIVAARAASALAAFAESGRAASVVVLAAGALAALAAPARATIVSVDDTGRSILLVRPAQRVATLAPSLTELVFAAGGGATLVATTTLSDFPPAARRIPRVGDAGRLDVERLVALKPDLVFVWQSGNTGRELDQLAAAGIPLYRLEPKRLDDVPRAIERIGVLLGREAEATARATDLRTRLAELRKRYAGAAPVRVFYQLWASPLMTVNATHLIGDAIRSCGGQNLFGALAPLVPLVSSEAVAVADPEAILAADERGGDAPAWRRDPASPAFGGWRRQAGLTAVRRDWLYMLNGDAISRQGPRIVDGVAAICAALDEVRRERAARAPR